MAATTKRKVPAATKVEVVENPLHDEMSKVITEVSRQFVGRDSPVKTLAFAVLTKQHVDFRGPVGTAKTQMVEEFFSRLGGDFFSVLCSPYTQREEFEGPVSIEALSQNRFERITTDALPEANWGFLDEFYKLPAELRNTMLKILNERRYSPAPGQWIACPLHTCAIASNEGPEEGPESPVADRFLYRDIIRSIDNNSQFSKLVKGSKRTSTTRTSLQLTDIGKMYEEVRAIEIPRAVHVLGGKLRNKINSQHFVSDRRWFWAIGANNLEGQPVASAVKASAWLAGRKKANESDLRIISNIAWGTPSEETTTRQIVQDMVKSPQDEVEKIYNDAREAICAVDSAKDGGYDVVVKATESIKTYIQQMRAFIDNDSVDQEWLMLSIGELQAAQKKFVCEQLNISMDDLKA